MTKTQRNYSCLRKKKTFKKYKKNEEIGSFGIQLPMEVGQHKSKLHNPCEKAGHGLEGLHLRNGIQMWYLISICISTHKLMHLHMYVNP